MKPIARTVSPTTWNSEVREEGEVREEVLTLDAKAAIQRILRGHVDMSRHGRIKTAYLHEYWTNHRRRSIIHEPGDGLLPDIGTKAVGVQRFNMLVDTANLKLIVR